MPKAKVSIPDSGFLCAYAYAKHCKCLCHGVHLPSHTLRLISQPRRMHVPQDMVLCNAALPSLLSSHQPHRTEICNGPQVAQPIAAAAAPSDQPQQPARAVAVAAAIQQKPDVATAAGGQRRSNKLQEVQSSQCGHDTQASPGAALHGGTFPRNIINSDSGKADSLAAEAASLHAVVGKQDHAEDAQAAHHSNDDETQADLPPTICLDYPESDYQPQAATTGSPQPPAQSSSQPEAAAQSFSRINLAQSSAQATINAAGALLEAPTAKIAPSAAPLTDIADNVPATVLDPGQGGDAQKATAEIPEACCSQQSQGQPQDTLLNLARHSQGKENSPSVASEAHLSRASGTRPSLASDARPSRASDTDTDTDTQQSPGEQQPTKAQGTVHKSLVLARASESSLIKCTAPHPYCMTCSTVLCKVARIAHAVAVSAYLYNKRWPCHTDSGSSHPCNEHTLMLGTAKLKDTR